jgi:glucose/arabinose dehydrogenase
MKRTAVSPALALLVALLTPSCPATAQVYSIVEAFPGLGFTQPLYLTHPGDGTDRIFVVQQDGLIRVFPNDSSVTSATVFLNVRNRLSTSSGEEGLLGLAFHPQYAENGWFFVNYTAPGRSSQEPKSVIARYRVSTDPNKADSLSELKILEFDQPYWNHNGGMLAFGPDGYLYIATGDGGSGNDPQNNGQNRQTLLGKILRIDVNNAAPGTPYAIPPDNPYAGNTQGFRQEIWAYGLRNPWRFSFDHETGDLWAGDVGQGAREEIDLISKGGNYGWKIMEGFICRPPTVGCDTTGLILPVKDYDRTLGQSVTGGYVYRGSRNPALRGAYVYGDFGSGRIWILRSNGTSLTEDKMLLDTPYPISSFGVDRWNELFVVDYGGKIYRLVEQTPTAVPPPARTPARSRLLQNYPNPFNPSTTIVLEVQERGAYTLRVFDMLGKEIATVLQDVLEPGLYERVFNAEGLAAGVYYCRLGSAAGIQSIRLLYLP